MKKLVSGILVVMLIAVGTFVVATYIQKDAKKDINSNMSEAASAYNVPWTPKITI